MTQPGDGQATLDEKNADFWSELCGTGLARSLGIDEITPASLERFDRAYLDLYPYLMPYVRALDVARKDVLEIGLGFGTVGQLLAEQGARYRGLDISHSPVEMMRDRLAMLGQADPAAVVQGSALDVPWAENSFDRVVSIGCLHHTGDLRRSIAEMHRVLRPGGLAFVMLYNRHSFRQLVATPRRMVQALRSREEAARRIRGRYDANSAGAAAPHTDYVSAREVRRLFSSFTHVRIDRQNFDTYVVSRFGHVISVRRERLLTNVARLLGLDLYIHAVK
jgi:SAM-dependent methyltransferase